MKKTALYIMLCFSAFVFSQEKLNEVKVEKKRKALQKSLFFYRIYKI